MAKTRITNLIRWRPSLRAAVVTLCLATTLTTAFIVSTAVSDHLARTAVNEALNSAETLVSGYVDPMFAGGQLDNPALAAPVDEQLQRLVSGGGFLRIKVWSAQGTVIYSDKPELRGRQFSLEDDLREALSGEPATDFSDGTADENVFEHGLSDRLLEMYMPIRVPGSGEVIGAYEVYEDAAPIEAEIGATRNDVLIIVGAMALLLLAIIFGAFSGASRLLARQNRRLRTSEERFRSLVQNSADVHMVVRPDLSIAYESSAVERVLGFRAGSRVGQKLLDGVYPEDAEWAAQMLAEAAGHSGGEVTAEVRLLHADGSWRWIELVFKNLRDDPAVGGIVVNYRDVTARRALEDELRHQAFHDALTGLPNRALFLDRLGHMLSRRHRFPGPLAVLFVDIDDFKTVNDSLGHAAGDELLVGVAHRLAGAVRAGDTIARMGGDEFAVLVEQASGQDAPADVAQRLLDSLHDPLGASGRDVFVRASVGLTVSTTSAETAEELLRNADLAMYTAKANGKSRIERFEPAMHDAAVTRLSLKADLERAVERGEFFLEYQPIVDFVAGQMPTVEALVRWRHPERGVINPGDFIPVVEETGLIVRLGRWVLEEACRQQVSWTTRTGWQLGMNVNVSARQFTQPSFAADVTAVIAATGIDPRHLALELTESTLMEDTELTAATLSELKRLGLRLAIDDFGTGYSSMNYLRLFPVDELKIDRSFIAAMSREPAQLAVVRSILRLGETLRLQVVAEGIEDEGQLTNLRALGARFGQGFALAAPMSAANIEALWLAETPQAGREVA